jgi:hypothetical protein
MGGHDRKTETTFTVFDKTIRRMFMKKFTAVFLFLFACTLGFAQESKEMEKKEMKGSHTMAGFLVDKMCGTKMAKLDAEKAEQKAMKHSKDCALEDACKESGYGILSMGKFVKFDEKGDKLAADYFNGTKKEKEFFVDVKGTMDGDMMKVESIKDAKLKVKKAEKKEEAK